jgi:hypothetical protein
MSILCSSFSEMAGNRLRRPANTRARVVEHASSSSSNFLHAGSAFMTAISTISADVSVSRARVPIRVESSKILLCDRNQGRGNSQCIPR